MFRCGMAALATWVMIMSAGCNAMDRDGGKATEGYIGSSGWKAWVNRQPPGPAKLIVVGQVKVSNAGHTPLLVFENLEQSNPPKLHLRLVVTQGTGADAITTKEARYESMEHPTVGGVRVTDPKGKVHEIKQVGTAQ